MRYNYKGFWGCDSYCDVEAHQRSDGKYVFVATELRGNPGTSVTNFAEHLATAVRSQYGLKPEEVIWIEHYPDAKDRRKEDFDLVRFLGIEILPDPIHFFLPQLHDENACVAVVLAALWS